MKKKHDQYVERKRRRKETQSMEQEKKVKHQELKEEVYQKENLETEREDLNEVGQVH